MTTKKLIIFTITSIFVIVLLDSQQFRSFTYGLAIKVGTAIDCFIEKQPLIALAIVLAIIVTLIIICLLYRAIFKKIVERNDL